MKIDEDIKRSFTNPFIWIAIAGGVLTLLNSYNQIDQNTVYIGVVEDRLNKKIILLNNLIEKNNEIKKELDLLKIEIEHELEMIKLDCK